MKNNDTMKLGCYRRIYDLIQAYIDPENPKLVVGFEVYDKTKVCLVFTGESYEAPLDEEYMTRIADMFLFDCPIIDGDETIRIYELGDTDIKFDVTTISLACYATYEGFAIDADKIEFAGLDGDTIVDFIKANPTFKMHINEDNEVVID